MRAPRAPNASTTPRLRGDLSRSCSEGTRSPAVLRDVAHQDAVDVRVEIDLDARIREAVELILVARRADVRPAVEHVRLVQAAFGMALLDRDPPGPWPVADAVGSQRRREPQVVLLRRFLAQACAAALAHLAREARAAALLPAELAPAQAVLAREGLEHRLHVRLRGEGTVERFGICAPPIPIDVPREQYLRRRA